MGGYAWVTLATNDSYSLGALVLAHSLKKSKTAHKSVVLITPAVSQPMREQLQSVFDVIQVVDVLDSKDEAHLALMQRPELGITFTKIHCWKLVEFDKCVFLDADTLVVRNCDELFQREEFSAAPDVSWPDCFNSGVFVFKPSIQTFNELLQFAVEKGSFDGGDQGLLNQFFSGWATEDIKKHLPFVYNLTSVAAYSYIPAFKHYGSETRIVHFIGAGKPWLQQLDPATRTITPTSGSEHLAPLLQQWWDLFCEKVHPNLNKNLESNNDGMSHPPVAACSNSLPIALTDDSRTPCLIEPCTPYREKDDFRQYNLPYQPFDVKGSSGELLNVEFLLTSAVSSPPEVVLDKGSREGDGMEKKNEREEKKDEKEEKNDSEVKENESGRETENSDFVAETVGNFRTGEKISEQKEVEVKEPNKTEVKEQEKQEQSNDPELPPPAVHPFDYNSFFPDETCVNKYLEHNVLTYQPYENHTHNHQQQNHQHNNSESSISQHFHESNSDVNVSASDPQPLEDPISSLPRFLTIPENDKRQSGNTETQPETKQAELQTKSDLPQVDPGSKSPDQPLPQEKEAEGKRELTKSKSMPYLRYDVTEMSSSGSIWKSQPNVNVDLNRKYSMPKLKPILPRQNSLSKSIPSIAPKVTLYTEFLMSSEYKDPVDLPKDKVGFVETLIHKKGQTLRRSKSAADIGDKFGPLPYVFSPEVEQPAVLKKTPLLHMDSELYDLSQCKRQMGNKPKSKDVNPRKENGHSLPALKPLVPPKDKKSTLIKKRKSKELSPGDGGKEKMFKKGPKMPKERKRECKTTPRNVSEGANGNVDDILTRLREFSKNYQHFFGVELQPQGRTDNCKNCTVLADEVVGRDASKYFLKTPSEGVIAIQPPRENKSEQEGSVVDSQFRHFRDYVKEKSKTSQKGLLSIQDLVSHPSRGEDEVTENAKASSETLGNQSESKRGVKSKINGGVERNDSVKGDDSVVKETSGKSNSVSHHSPAGRDEVEEDCQGDSKLYRTPANEDSMKDNSKRNVKSATHSTRGEPKEVKTNSIVKNSSGSNSSLSDESKSKARLSNRTEEDIDESQNTQVVSGTENEVLLFRERKSQTNGLEGENLGSKGSSKEIKSNKDTEPNVEENTGRTFSMNSDSREEPTANSYSDGIMPNENGGSEVFGSASEAAGSPLLGEAPEKEMLSKLSAEGSVSEFNLVSTKAAGAKDHRKLRVEESKYGEALISGNKSEERPALCRRKEEHVEEKGSHDKAKKSGEVLFDTPRSSRVSLPTSKSVAIEVIEEIITKATLQQSQTSVQSRRTPRKTPKSKCPPKKRSGTPNNSPGATAPSLGERTFAAAGKLSPPSLSNPRNGNPLPESHEDTKISSGIAGAIAQLSLEAGSDQSHESAAAASTAHQEYVRRQNWETGNMDYLGRDSFDNIWSKICQTLEGKESEKTGPAAEDPKQSKQPSAPSATTPAEESRTPEPPPVAETPASLSSVPQKCPEYMETLPAESAAGPVEDDEIIFSKPDKRQSALTNITEIKEDGKESSALGAKPPETEVKVKLSDILQPEASSSGQKETSKSGKEKSIKTPPQKSSEEEKAGAPAGEKSEEKPEVVKVQPGSDKVECETVTLCGPPLLPEQVLPAEGSETSVKDEKSDKKAQECTTVAIPSPPIHFPGAPFTDKDKKAQSRRKPEERTEDQFEPIPLPPPETPTQSPPPVKTLDSSKDQVKPKKGVFSKILEMVGVAPKDKGEDEIPKSVFYDVEGAASSKPSEDENATATELEKQAAVETKEVTSVDEVGKNPEEVIEAQVVPITQSKDAEETKKEVIVKPQEQKPEEAAKPKTPIEKPARNISPKDPAQLSKNSIQITPKSRSPSPKLTLPKELPTTAITAPTPPPQPDFPPRKISGLLKVDETIPETPPIPEPPKEGTEESVKGKVLAEVEDIIGKAKSEVESRLQERRSAEKETGEGTDLINTMKLMVGSEEAQSPEAQLEELRVTSEEERMRHKGEVVSSKLSDQILKAIPPPRRKAISEGSASSSAIPKPLPEQKSVPGEGKGKSGKPSSIPVPPPRNRGKPTQPTPAKGKGKK